MFRTCSWHFYNMFTICSWNIYNMFHDLFMTCSWHIHGMFTTCLQHVHNMFTTFSSHVHHIFITCSPHVQHRKTDGQSHTCRGALPLKKWTIPTTFFFSSELQSIWKQGLLWAKVEHSSATNQRQTEWLLYEPVTLPLDLIVLV